MWKRFANTNDKIHKNMNDDEKNLNEDDAPEEEVKELMDNHDIDQDTAERAQELVDEGLDEDGAVEIAEEGL